jgi:hypothetical protein
MLLLRIVRERSRVHDTCDVSETEEIMHLAQGLAELIRFLSAAYTPSHVARIFH